MEDITPLNDEQLRHRIAFYQAALSVFFVQAENGSMMKKEKWEVVRAVCIRLHNDETRSELKREGYSQIAQWDKKYGIVKVGEEIVLVERPTTRGNKKKKWRHHANAEEDDNEVDDDLPEPAITLPVVDLDHMHRPSYMERLYHDILREHVDHNRGLTLAHKVAEWWCNVSHDWTNLFCKTCPGCIERAPKPKPVAGLRNIITSGFGMRGQVDIVDLQGMPDGLFKYLLNYIDHGVKFLWSMPLVSKRAAMIALALYEISAQLELQ